MFVMKYLITLLICTITLTNVSGQGNNEYVVWATKAMSLYRDKQFKQSAEAYMHAFASNGGVANPEDEYNAACSWSLAGIKDSAFALFDKMVAVYSFADYDHLAGDADLNNLHSDTRWKSLCAAVLKNKQKKEAKYNKPVVAILDTVLQFDQMFRLRIEETQKKYRFESKEMKQLWDSIGKYDSINLIKVEKIVDKYGWLGPEVIGEQGNSTIFLVIQHSNTQVQKKYLPEMRKAVEKKAARPDEVAMLEDRIAIASGELQIYGTQLQGNVDGSYVVSPLVDPGKVDERRASVGLPPMAVYLSQWNMKWDVEEYKKKLPDIIKKTKRN